MNFIRNAALAVIAAGGLSLAGCFHAAGPSPIAAPINFSKGPLAVGDTGSGSSKVGKAEAMGILLVGFGDASISAAMAKGGIQKIHHVDTETMSILGLFSTQTTVVYGE